MRILKNTYDTEAECFAVEFEGDIIVVGVADGRPIEPIGVDAISVQIEKTIWVAYPSQVDGDSSTYLVILIVNSETGDRAAPVLVSEPLTHLVASDHLELASKAWDPINELQAGVHFRVIEGNG